MGTTSRDDARDPLSRLAAALAARSGSEPDALPAADDARLAAVALILREREPGEAELLFIKRAEYESDPWSGQIAFPGGRHEPGDGTLRDTALRETLEETGIDVRAAGRMLGVLDDLRPRNPALPAIVIRPYVAVIGDVAITRSPEVAETFWVPLSRLRSPDAVIQRTVTVRGHRMDVPCYLHDGHTIWGITERMVTQLLALLA